MAHQSIGHDHCGVCGECLLHSGLLHRCPAPVDMAILATILLTRVIPAKPTAIPLSQEDEQMDWQKVSRESRGIDKLGRR